MLLVAATFVVVLIFLYDCKKRFEFKYRESLSLSYLKPFAIKKNPIFYFIMPIKQSQTIRARKRRDAAGINQFR